MAASGLQKVVFALRAVSWVEISPDRRGCMREEEEGIKRKILQDADLAGFVAAFCRLWRRDRVLNL